MKFYRHNHFFDNYRGLVLEKEDSTNSSNIVYVEIVCEVMKTYYTSADDKDTHLCGDCCSPNDEKITVADISIFTNNPNLYINKIRCSLCNIKSLIILRTVDVFLKFYYNQLFIH